MRPHRLSLLAPLLVACGWRVAEADTAEQSVPGMVWIPAGEFKMGTDAPDSQPNERPAHRVKLSGFWMDETLVTNAQFRQFVDATHYVTVAERPVDWEKMKKELPPGSAKPPDVMLVPGALVYSPPDHDVSLDDLAQWWRWVPGAEWKHPEGPGSTIEGKEKFPVVQVCWDDAEAYAKWAGKRLPTEAEWEYAAWGGATANTRFWWGDELHPNGKFMANVYTGKFPVRDTAEDGYAGRSPVKAFPANHYGLYDMAGNVWQWTADWYRVDLHAGMAQTCCSLNPAGPANTFDPTDPYSPRRVIKGGSYLCNVSYCESYRPTARRGTPTDTGSEHVGFRCVKSPAPPAAQASNGPELRHGVGQ